MHLLPDGFLMMAPTKLMPMAITPILSPLGKLRAGLELLMPSRKDDMDESMASFVKRRLGREVYERLVEPLVSGVYAADMEKLSVLATLPRFREMERQYGSLIRAMQRQLKANKQARLAEQSGARYSMFITLRSGLATLCQTIAEHLQRDRFPAAIQLNKEITAVEKAAGGWRLAGETFDAVIYACPVSETAKLLRTAAAAEDACPAMLRPLTMLADKLSGIEHEGTAIATFAFDAGQIKQEFRGMGFVVPKIENNPILAGSFSSLKYEHRAPKDKFLIRVFAGGARNPHLADMPDSDLVPMLFRELRKIIRIDGEPLFSAVSHWAGTMPQYHVGHRERVREIENIIDSMTGIAVAGNAFHGVGIPNCIQSGFQAAEKIAAELTRHLTKTNGN
jgi:oxygen-dependent protoporphyrinogen oxidase